MTVWIFAEYVWITAGVSAQCSQGCKKMGFIFNKEQKKKKKKQGGTFSPMNENTLKSSALSLQ